jgi:hypothetical protein
VTEADSSTRAKIEHRAVSRIAEDSETSADETEPENGMTFIRRHNVRSSHTLRRSTNGKVIDSSIIMCVCVCVCVYIYIYIYGADL